MKANEIIEGYELYLELKNHFKSIVASELLAEVLKSEQKDEIMQEDFSKGYALRSEQVEYLLKNYILN